jgi:Zn finger protein HypA/HybF involved in hydrogenase expression
MHETVFAKQIIEAAEAQGKVKGIVIEVGDLAHVSAEEMKEVMERLKPDWEIKTVEKKALVRCKCGYEGEPDIKEHSHDHTVFFCLRCEEVPEILEGKDIVLKSVEVE